MSSLDAVGSAMQAQSASLQWLPGEPLTHCVPKAPDVYKHPEVSCKNPGEARSVA